MIEQTSHKVLETELCAIPNKAGGLTDIRERGNESPPETAVVLG